MSRLPVRRMVDLSSCDVNRRGLANIVVAVYAVRVIAERSWSRAHRFVFNAPKA